MADVTPLQRSRFQTNLKSREKCLFHGYSSAARSQRDDTTAFSLLTKEIDPYRVQSTVHSSVGSIDRVWLLFKLRQKYMKLVCVREAYLLDALYLPLR